MTKITVDTKFRWRILQPTEVGHSYVGICDRLGITTEAESLDELILSMNDCMCILIKCIWEDKEWNQYAFDHSIAFTTDDDVRYVDIIPSPVVTDK